MPFRRLAAIALAATAGCAPVTILNNIVPIHARQTKDIAYGPAPRQKLDMYRPSDAPANQLLPTIVFVYGGGWRSGERAEYKFVAESFASKGYVVVVPDYRLFPDVSFPVFVDDVALAVRWTADHAGEIGADRGNLFLMGHSAGAQIGALVALDRGYLDAVGMDRSAIRGFVGLAGPYAFQPRPQDVPVFQSASRPSFQAIDFADGSATPMLLVHGTADDIVAPENSGKLNAKLLSLNRDVTYLTYPGMGHVGAVLSLAAPFTWLAPVRRDVLKWLAAHSASPRPSAPVPAGAGGR